MGKIKIVRKDGKKEIIEEGAIDKKIAEFEDGRTKYIGIGTESELEKEDFFTPNEREAVVDGVKGKFVKDGYSGDWIFEEDEDQDDEEDEGPSRGDWKFGVFFWGAILAATLAYSTCTGLRNYYNNRPTTTVSTPTVESKNQGYRYCWEKDGNVVLSNDSAKMYKRVGKKRVIDQDNIGINVQSFDGIVNDCRSRKNNSSLEGSISGVNYCWTEKGRITVSKAPRKDGKYSWFNGNLENCLIDNSGPINQDKKNTIRYKRAEDGTLVLSNTPE